MASIEDIEAALSSEQARALDIAEASMTTVAWIVTFSTYVLTVLALALAALAIFGWVAIFKGARAAAEKVATEKVDAYIKSQEFDDKINVAVAREVRERVGDKIILAHMRQDRDGADPEPFPPAPKGRPP